MEIVETARSFRVDLTIEQFKVIMERDEHNDHCLDDRLKWAGCESIEYNGFFGPAVFFSLDIDSLEVLEQVREIISNYIA